MLCTVLYCSVICLHTLCVAVTCVWPMQRLCGIGMHAVMYT